jgi:hypothetical protein
MEKEKPASGQYRLRVPLRRKSVSATAVTRPSEKAARKLAASEGRSAKLVAKAILSRQLGLQSAVRSAFVERSAAAIARIASQADERKLQQALSASTDVGTLAAVLSDAEALGEGVRELDPMASLIARAVKHKAELIARAGGVLTVQQVAQLLGITRQAVDKRRRERKLLAIPRGGDFRYPAAQFSDGEVVAGLRDVLAAVGLQGPWGTLAFLVAPDDELEGESPLDWLKHHPGQLAPVLRLARAQGEHGA